MSDNKKLTIELNERTVVGKKVQSLRSQGVLPGVINEHGKESSNVSVALNIFEGVYKEAGRTQPVDFSIDGKKHLGMIKEIEREPVKGKIIHFTIQAIKANEKVTAEVPVHLDEEVDIPAKRVGLDVIAVTHSFEIEALPHNLPEQILVDGSKLNEVGDRVLVSDIKLPEGVELPGEDDLEKVLFIVEAPRVTSEEDLANDTPEEGEEESAADVPSDNGAAEEKTEE
ncbi:MAG TPA: 50S ribosomal protein L25 [Candidatus Saccharimonadales bacterium]|nr:50S ribosomal protein L25 [Candidatus Saccharimonadales bacterium]